ncbi:hypothetical protein Tco_1542286, partial [Tanacetum coccineum]
TNKYLAPVAITYYREKKLHEIIDWDLRKEMDSESFDIFAETAYECLNEERSQRPNIDEIVPKLEKALKVACENRPVRPLFFSSIILSELLYNLLEYLVIRSPATPKLER